MVRVLPPPSHSAAEWEHLETDTASTYTVSEESTDLPPARAAEVVRFEELGIEAPSIPVAVFRLLLTDSSCLIVCSTRSIRGTVLMVFSSDVGQEMKTRE